MMLRQVRRNVEGAQDLHGCERRAHGDLAPRVGRRDCEVDVEPVYELLELSCALEWRRLARVPETAGRVRASPRRCDGRGRERRRRAMFDDAKLADHLLGMKEGLTFARVDEVSDRLVVCRAQAKSNGLGGDRAVQRVDLRSLAA